MIGKSEPTGSAGPVGALIVVSRGGWARRRGVTSPTPKKPSAEHLQWQVLTDNTFLLYREASCRSSRRTISACWVFASNEPLSPPAVFRVARLGARWRKARCAVSRCRNVRFSLAGATTLPAPRFHVSQPVRTHRGRLPHGQCAEADAVTDSGYPIPSTFARGQEAAAMARRRKRERAARAQ